MVICKFLLKNEFLVLLIVIFLNTPLAAKTVFDDLKNVKKTSYLDFILLKIENTLGLQSKILGAQAIPFRIQYQVIGTRVDYVEKDSKILISVEGVMDKRRYKKKKYVPSLTDCNVLRNLLLFRRYGYNVFLSKRNSFLTVEQMKEIFKSNFLNNLSLSKKEVNFLLENTLIKVKIIDPVRGNDVFCSGKVFDDELR